MRGDVVRQRMRQRLTRRVLPTQAVVSMKFDQGEFDIRCAWGSAGVRHFVANSDAIVIVDVLSFSTCVPVLRAGAYVPHMA